MAAFPAAVEQLFWDVDPGQVDIERHRSYVMERVMSRGTWEAMRWLLATYSAAAIREFVEAQGQKVLTPEVLAFWSLMSDARVVIPTGGGRPRWAGG